MTGIGALGFSVAFLFVPLLPEIVASVSEKEGLENNPFLSDKASGIYNCAYGVGNCLAPMIGGAISQAKGFRVCCDIMGFSSLGFAGIYFLFALVPAWIEEKRKREEIEKGLLENFQNGGSVENSITMEFDGNKILQFGNINNTNTLTKIDNNLTTTTGGPQVL